MAATIRLARHGSKKRPFYRIVVSDRRFASDGRRLEQVGIYDPNQNPSRIEFQTERLSNWLRRGAQPSQTVRQLMKKRGIQPVEQQMTETQSGAPVAPDPAPGESS
jgi:small subunit ribosomal protein S16